MRVHVVFVFNLLNIVMQKSFERKQSMYYNSLSVLSTNLKQYEVTTLRHCG